MGGLFPVHQIHSRCHFTEMEIVVGFKFECGYQLKSLMINVVSLKAVALSYRIVVCVLL